MTREFSVQRVLRKNVPGNPVGYQVSDQNGPLPDAVYSSPAAAQGRIGREKSL